MNVYDFDNTILRGDTTARFFAYCLLRTPRMWLDAPGQAANALLFLTRLRKKQVFKARLFRFFRYVRDVDGALAAFWEKNFTRIKKFYLITRRMDDVIISASPEFLVRPACERLGTYCVMGSQVDKKTGKFHGISCHGAEKVRRFRERFPHAEIDEFYSDSYSDTPLARLAKQAYRVKGDKLLPWRMEH